MIHKVCLSILAESVQKKRLISFCLIQHKPSWRSRFWIRIEKTCSTKTGTLIISYRNSSHSLVGERANRRELGKLQECKALPGASNTTLREVEY